MSPARYTVRAITTDRMRIHDTRTGMSREVTAYEMTRNQPGYDPRTAEFPAYVHTEFWALWDAGQNARIAAERFCTAAA